MKEFKIFFPSISAATAVEISSSWRDHDSFIKNNKERQMSSTRSTPRKLRSETPIQKQKFSGAIEVNEKNEIIKKFIESRGVTLLFGPQGSGKTTTLVKKCLAEQEKGNNSPSSVLFIYDDSKHSNTVELFGGEENLKKVEKSVQITTFLGLCRYLIEKLGVSQDTLFIDEEETRLMLEKIIRLNLKGSISLFFFIIPIHSIHLFFLFTIGGDIDIDKRVNEVIKQIEECKSSINILNQSLTSETFTF